MRTFIFSLITLFFLGCEQKFEFTNIDTNISLDKKDEKLSKRHLEYWEYRSKKDAPSSYMYEMPYQRFIRSLQWYKMFHEGGREHFTITQKHISIHNSKALIESQFKYKKSTYTFKDPWFFVNGQWYHQFETSKLP